MMIYWRFVPAISTLSRLVLFLSHTHTNKYHQRTLIWQSSQNFFFFLLLSFLKVMMGAEKSDKSTFTDMNLRVRVSERMNEFDKTPTSRMTSSHQQSHLWFMSMGTQWRFCKAKNGLGERKWRTHFINIIIYSALTALQGLSFASIAA